MNRPHDVEVGSLKKLPAYKRKLDRKQVRLLANTYRESGIPPSHTLLARRMDDHRFQIIDGHRRYLAASFAKLKTVPVWVEDCTEEQAVALHIQRNSREAALTDLELGFMLLELFPPGGESKGGRGQTGGMRALAPRIGKSESVLRNLRRAAQVAQSAGMATRFERGSVSRLAAVGVAPPCFWPALAGPLLASEKTAKQIANFSKGLRPLRNFELDPDRATQVVALALEAGSTETAATLASAAPG